jgi:hypothetical protein
VDYSPTIEFVQWFEREIGANAEVLTITEAPEPVLAFEIASPYAVLMLAEEGNRRRDELRCDSIRAQAYVADKRQQRQKVVRCVRALLVWLVAFVLFAGGMWWMVTR